MNGLNQRLEIILILPLNTLKVSSDKLIISFT